MHSLILAIVEKSKLLIFPVEKFPLGFVVNTSFRYMFKKGISLKIGDYISSERKVNLISDVDSLVPVKLKKLFSFIEEVIETNEKTLLSVYRKIEESGESIDFVQSVIEYSFNIRPLNIKPLLSLHCLLSQKHGYKNDDENNNRLYSLLLQQGIICKPKRSYFFILKKAINKTNEMLTIIKHDDIESFIEKKSEAKFNT